VLSSNVSVSFTFLCMWSRYVCISSVVVLFLSDYVDVVHVSGIKGYNFGV
jgi:hypothetical protein